ncbi:hypothetical protein V5O48_000986 [Marasmius crinis-equi]|uniref:SP-RING-type domain-containing protein n=1 Tax=Marasmius crinis-equi TaxID=585013 RepID=A0ABR3FZJ6_9AGAR
MAIASSSRRKASRREPTSDIDEDAPADNSRMQVDDDVDEEEDEEEQSRRTTKKGVKQTQKASTKGKGRAETDEEDEDGENHDDDEDDDSVIDVENFPDHPLEKSIGIEKLKGFSSEWNQLANAIEGAESAVEAIALALAESIDGDAAEKEILGIEATLKHLIDVENEVKLQQKLLSDLAQTVATQDVSDIMNRYITGSKEQKKHYKEMTTRQKYAKHATYKTFKESLHAVDHPGEAMPPITDFIPEESGDQDDEDEEIEVGGVTQDFKCPITLRELQDPVTSSICGHSFSRDALRELFANERGGKKCPASGCNKSFRFADCASNKLLAQRMRIHAKRQKEKNAVSADEIIG